MKENISPVIQASELLEIYRSENLVIIDASNGENARYNYDKKHLDGALYVDLNTQLSEIKEDPANGGRHPLPTVEKFSETLTNLGISKDSHLIIYDDSNGANAAARFWWMLKSVGHEKVQVLNGSIQEAEKIGFPVNSKINIPNRTETYIIEKWELPLSDIFEVEKVSHDKKYILIDVRASERFKGEIELIDSIAGHIPGAVNIPYASNLNEDGLFLPPAELKKKYKKIFDETQKENIIVYCGSGVTACHTLLAIDYAGLEIPKLYVGSWSEWSLNKKPIA